MYKENAAIANIFMENIFAFKKNYYSHKKIPRLHLQVPKTSGKTFTLGTAACPLQ